AEEIRLDAFVGSQNASKASPPRPLKQLANGDDRHTRTNASTAIDELSRFGGTATTTATVWSGSRRQKGGAAVQRPDFSVCRFAHQKRTSRLRPPACLPFPSNFPICRLFSKPRCENLAYSRAASTSPELERVLASRAAARHLARKRIDQT